jgi:serine/threonine protein kinase
VEALVSERLTSFDRIANIYGHCGVAILSEFLDYGDIEMLVIPGTGYIQRVDLNDTAHLRPQNKLSAILKLQVALEMAEAISILHEYPEGIIVHNDISPSQFLFDSDGNIKLNDFNRAEIMLWNEETKEYCKYRNGAANGNYRAPEEYFDKPLDEKIDIYSFGNNIYTLLTGLWPFYELDYNHVNEVQEMIKKGFKPFIDERYRTSSLEEAILVDIMEECWAFNPEDRPEIKALVKRLQVACLKLENSKTSVKE